MSLAVVLTVSALRAQVSDWRRAGETIAIVPTMGALHEGHLALVRAARARADRVIVTIFVNPAQFNDPDDLAKYPRTEAEDVAKLGTQTADLLFAPMVEEIYPQGFATKISVSGISEDLCGASRPGHFDGVATIVAKLFLQSGADIAVFGEKDFQQLAIIRRMARDLDIPIDIVGVPTVREADGLALSSRNVRLSPDGRRRASALPRALAAATEAIRMGAAPDASIAKAQQEMLAWGFTAVEYIALRDAQTLAPVAALERPARLLAAAWIDNVRLIDNVAVNPV